MAMRSLTKREKVLIFFVLCLLLIVGGLYLIVLPNLETYSTLSDQVATAEIQQQQMTAAIESMPDLTAARDSAAANLAALKGQYPQHLPNEGLDSLLTRLCLEYNLSPHTLLIGTNAYAGVPVFTEAAQVYQTNPDATVEKDSTTATTEETATDSEVSTTEDTAAGTGGNAWTGIVTMQVTGSIYDFQSLLDAVEARNDIVIQSYEVTPVAQEADPNSAVKTFGYKADISDGTNNYTVTFIVYMLDQ